MPSFGLIDKLQIEPNIGCADLFDMKIRVFAGAKGFDHNRPVFDAADKFFAIGIVNIDHRTAALAQHLVKQTGFCGKIIIHIAMVIEMIAA